jgi:hypothetical protein
MPYVFNYPALSGPSANLFSSDEGDIEVNESTTDDVKLIAKWPVLQSGRGVSSPPFFVRASSSTELVMEATIFSSLARPFKLGVSIAVQVEKRSMTWREILETAGEAIPDKDDAS